MEKIIELHPGNIQSEHICCAISDKKCAGSYQKKKDWLHREFDKGYVFRRIDARAKVFMESVPAEAAWIPVNAPNYLMINCFWVSGRYKGQGYGKALLQAAMDDAAAQDMHGLVSVVGTRKFHFMSHTKWFLRQGFQACEELDKGFSLLVKKRRAGAPDPSFLEVARHGESPHKEGLVAYYTNRCPFSEYHVTESLPEAARKRKLPLKVIKLNSLEEARSAPTPATIFSLFYQGKFVTTDLSVCMDSRFDKLMAKHL